MKRPKLQYEHPTQTSASTFLQAIVAGDPVAIWAHLSRETRGLLEGLYAGHAGVALHRAAGVDGSGDDARLAEIVRPLRGSVLWALGGPEKVGGYGVSGARLADRDTAYVLLLPDFGDERVVTEDEWRPSHLLAFIHESREWLIDMARTSELSADAELPDLLGAIRR
ncbi:MAG TPA: hypothetical protein VGQ86_02250 [Candidatus Limnocylindria bacterium]|jgi:hypothetical protein|nr:hypothetical protein [Candidatus Limnocylindria bacterium]